MSWNQQTVTFGSFKVEHTHKRWLWAFSDVLGYRHKQQENYVPTLRNIYKTLACQYDLLGFLITFTTTKKYFGTRSGNGATHIFPNVQAWLTCCTNALLKLHIELLLSIDTNSFLMSLRRCIAHRGKPYELQHRTLECPNLEPWKSLEPNLERASDFPTDPFPSEPTKCTTFWSLSWQHCVHL